jgi:hypothetical protein
MDLRTTSVDVNVTMTAVDSSVVVLVRTVMTSCKLVCLLFCCIDFHVFVIFLYSRAIELSHRNKADN